MPNPKEKLLLASATYPGNFGYYEKLIPFLNKYEVFFLFTPKAKEHFLPEMIQHCQKKGYPYFLLPKYSLNNKILRKIPLFYPIAEAYDFRKRVKGLLKDRTITRIISIFDMDLYDGCLFKEANKLGIKTMLLQWALSSPIIRPRHQIKPKMSVRVIYSYFVRAHQFLARLLLRYVLGFEFKPRKVNGSGNSQKFGVINQQAYNLYKKWGVKPEKMSIIGYLDFDLAQKTKEEFDNNPAIREKTAQKYNIDLSKQNIAIFSTPFDRRDIKILSQQEQLAYFGKIIKTIREVFSPDEADILFKIHPGEDFAFYQPLRQCGVKLYDKYTVNRELIYFADLYITHHSTTSFIPIRMHKEAIFVNFCQLAWIESAKKYLGVKKFISDPAEFKKMLIDFKNHCLEKQYIHQPEIFTENSIEKMVNWIG